MAFAKGNQSTEGAVKKLYKGVGSFYVLGVNPTKAEQEKFFGTTMDKEPEYIGEQDGVKTVRISFVVKVDGEKHKDAEGKPIELVTNHTFFLRNQPMVSQAGKTKVIDAYGNTAWVTEEEFNNKAIPMSSSGKPINIATNYRKAYNGEEELTKFLSKYMVIDSCFTWGEENGKRKITGWAANLADCECRLDDIKSYFSGNFKELKTILSYQPNNKVKIAVGVKTNNEGKQFQTTFTKDCMGNGSKSFGSLDKAIKDAMANSSSNVDYTGDGNKSSIGELSEYVVTATNFNSTPAADMPFASNAATSSDLPFSF